MPSEQGTFAKNLYKSLEKPKKELHPERLFYLERKSCAHNESVAAAMNK